MRALVLSGGGSKGAFQVGVLKRWLIDEAVDYDVLCGVSVGALNIAGLATCARNDPTHAALTLEWFWKYEIKGTSSIYKRWFPFGRLHSLWERSIYDSSPLRKLVHDHIDHEKILISNRKLYVGAVCLDTGEHLFKDESQPNFIDWILASASYPIFMSPIEINGKLYSDGGLVNLTPLEHVIGLGATEIDVIMCNDPFAPFPWTSDKKSAIPYQALRAIDLMSKRVASADVERYLKHDWFCHNGPKPKIRCVVPSTPLRCDSMKFDPHEIDEMIRQGYNDALNAVIYT